MAGFGGSRAIQDRAVYAQSEEPPDNRDGVMWINTDPDDPEKDTEVNVFSLESSAWVGVTEAVEQDLIQVQDDLEQTRNDLETLVDDETQVLRDDLDQTQADLQETDEKIITFSEGFAPEFGG